MIPFLVSCLVVIFLWEYLKRLVMEKVFVATMATYIYKKISCIETKLSRASRHEFIRLFQFEDIP